MACFIKKLAGLSKHRQLDFAKIIPKSEHSTLCDLYNFLHHDRLNLHAAHHQSPTKKQGKYPKNVRAANRAKDTRL